MPDTVAMSDDDEDCSIPIDDHEPDTYLLDPTDTTWVGFFTLAMMGAPRVYLRIMHLLISAGLDVSELIDCVDFFSGLGAVPYAFEQLGYTASRFEFRIDKVSIM